MHLLCTWSTFPQELQRKSSHKLSFCLTPWPHRSYQSRCHQYIKVLVQQFLPGSLEICVSSRLLVHLKINDIALFLGSLQLFPTSSNHLTHGLNQSNHTLRNGVSKSWCQEQDTHYSQFAEPLSSCLQI